MNIANRTLSKSQHKIADYLHKNEQDIPYITEKEIASSCGVSVATVSRFWNAAGFDNLRDFKQHYKSESFVTPASKLQKAVDKSNHSYLEDMHNEATHHLSMTAAHASADDLEGAIETLAQANTIHIYGSGSAQSLISLLSFRLRRFDRQVKELAPSGHEIFEDMVHIEQGDVIVIFGFVQSSPEIDVLLDFAASEKIDTVLITDLLYSPLLERVSHVLYTSRGEATEFHSMVAPIALIEVIIVQIGKKLGASGMHKLHRLHKLRRQYQHRLPKK